MRTCVLWFRANLRLGDNMPVSYAYAHYDRVIPIYLDAGSQHDTQWGNVEIGSHRRQFLNESLVDLNKELALYGSELYVLKGNLDRLKQAVLELQAEAIIGPKEMAYNECQEEKDLQEWATNIGIKSRFFLERTLYASSSLPFGLQDLPEVFSKFRGKVEKRAQVVDPIEEPQVSHIVPASIPFASELSIERLATIHPQSAHPLKGGTREAWKQLDYYIWDSERITTYKETRNQLLGTDFSSKISAYLALGCISARQVNQEIKRFEEDIVANESTYWLFFELLWREYFQWIGLKHGNKLYLRGGLQPEKPMEQGFNQRAFEKWVHGNTGDAFVDANMKELNQTGFMSNRGRQNVASYLIHDMGLDWRAGASYFESQLVDFDPCSNYGNWLYIAGRGNDPRPFRKFNTKAQVERYDPQGAYINAWL